MTMITAISMPIWPTIWPYQAFSALRMTREQDRRRRHRAEQHVGAADHDRDERFDDEGDAHRRDQRHGRRVQRAAESGERRAEAEADRVDARVRTPSARAIAAFCIVARASMPKPVRMKSR